MSSKFVTQIHLKRIGFSFWYFCHNFPCKLLGYLIKLLNPKFKDETSVGVSMRNGT